MLNEFKPIVRNSNFLFLWWSQILSQLTINIMNFLLLVRLFSNTGSTIATSFLWVAYALPAILVGPFAAVSVDMVERRKMLMVTNLLQSLTILIYAISHQTRIFLLYGVAVAYSFLNQFYVPAEAASLPSLVKKPNLPQANGLFFLTQEGALIIGFAVAGFMNKYLGFNFSLFICASLLFLAFVSVSFLPAMRVRDKLPKSFEVAFGKFFTRIIEGYKFIKEHNQILAPFLILMAFQIAMTIVMISVPVVATDILKIDVNSAGIYIVVPAGIGAAIGALAIPKMLKAGWRKKRTIENSLMLLSFVAMMLTFVVPEIEGISRIISGGVVIALAGVAFVGILIPSQTYLQEATPGGLRGRVFGNYWFLATIATIFPVIFSGALAELFGVKLILFLLGGLTLGALIASKRFGQKFVEDGFELKIE